jgi:hypothetical protein
MIKDQRKIISATVGELSPRELDTTLAKAKAYIEDLIALHGPDAQLDWDPYFYYDYDPNPSPRYRIMVRRPETNEEQSKRLAEEKKRKDQQAERDRAEFERLSKQFGKK